MARRSLGWVPCLFVLGCGARTAGELGAQPDAAGPTCALVTPAAAENTSTCPGGPVDASGGAIADGTYEVAAYYLYESACGGYVRVARESITFHGDTIEDAVDVTKMPFGSDGLGAASAKFTYTTSGATMTLTGTCVVYAPGMHALTTVLDRGDYLYTSVMGSVLLFIPASPPRLFAVLRKI